MFVQICKLFQQLHAMFFNIVNIRHVIHSLQNESKQTGSTNRRSQNQSNGNHFFLQVSIRKRKKINQINKQSRRCSRKRTSHFRIGNLMEFSRHFCLAHLLLYILQEGKRRILHQSTLVLRLNTIKNSFLHASVVSSRTRIDKLLSCRMFDNDRILIKCVGILLAFFVLEIDSFRQWNCE